METLLKKIDGFSIKSYKKINISGTGNYQSKRLGESFDFYGHRNYVPGDEIGKIDWKVYSRTKQLNIKEYTDKRRTRVNVIIDKSLSMDSGTINKLEYAKKIACGIAYLSSKEGNLTNIVSFSEEISYLKDEKTKGDFYQTMETIRNTLPSGRTNFENLNKILKGFDGISFVISDFIGNARELELGKVNIKNKDLRFIQILDEEELEPKQRGEYIYIDSETKKETNIILNETMIEKYKEKINAYILNLEKNLNNQGISYYLAKTKVNPVQVIKKSAMGV